MGKRHGMKSQNEEILSWLTLGKSLTPLLALEKFGTFRLSGRIFDLRKQGHKIEMCLVEYKGKRFAEYRLSGV